MKKLKLKAMEAGAQEFLSRHQLKNVLGGWEDDATTTTAGCGGCGMTTVLACERNSKGNCECPGTGVCA